jgi:hypothetical protein
MQQEGASEARRGEAAEEFDGHEGRSDGARIVASLADGSTLLRNLLYSRVHQDVERVLGKDSMVMPISEMKTEKQAKTEIELYQIAVSAGFVRDRAYAGMEDEWYLRWFTRLRLGEPHADEKVSRRLADYVSKTEDERRLAFTNVLARVLPESRRAPLVLFRLLPLAVKIATALAFDDRQTAAETRRQQAAELPAVTDCRTCHGELLDNGKQCQECGSPLWKYEWLTTTD